MKRAAETGNVCSIEATESKMAAAAAVEVMVLGNKVGFKMAILRQISGSRSGARPKPLSFL